MGKTYKVWVEIEILQDGDPVGNGSDDLGILPDSAGEFRTARQAIARQAEIAKAFSSFADTSDAVKAVQTTKRSRVRT